MRFPRRAGILVAILAAASLAGCAESSTLDIVPAAVTIAPGSHAKAAGSALQKLVTIPKTTAANAAKALAPWCKPAVEGALHAALPYTYAAEWPAGTFTGVPKAGATTPRGALYSAAGAVACSWQGDADDPIDQLQVAALADGESAFTAKKTALSGPGTSVTNTTYRDCSVTSVGWSCDVGLLVHQVWTGALFAGDADITASTAAKRADGMLAALKRAFGHSGMLVFATPTSSWTTPTDCAAFDPSRAIATAAGVSLDSTDSQNLSIEIDPAGATLARTGYFGCDWWQSADSGTDVQLELQVLPGAKPTADAFRKLAGGYATTVTVTGAKKAVYRCDGSPRGCRIDVATTNGWFEVRVSGSDRKTVTQPLLLAAANQALQLLDNPPSDSSTN